MLLDLLAVAIGIGFFAALFFAVDLIDKA